MELRENGLHEISANAFDGLRNTLTELDLHGNHLASIPSHALDQLDKLRHLDLSRMDRWIFLEEINVSWKDEDQDCVNNFIYVLRK